MARVILHIDSCHDWLCGHIHLLRCAVLGCAALCYAVLRCAALCCAVLRCAELCCFLFPSAMLFSTKDQSQSMHAGADQLLLIYDKHRYAPDKPCKET